MSTVGAIGVAFGICILILLGMMLCWILKCDISKRKKFDGRETQQLDNSEHSSHDDRFDDIEL